MVWIRRLSLSAALGLLLYVPTPHPFGSLVGALLGAAYFGLLALASCFRSPRDLPATGERREPEASGGSGTPPEKEPHVKLIPAVAAALCVLCAVRELQAIFQLPIDSGFADMLPLVRSALETFCSGQPAYRVYSMPWPLPLTFLPLLWLSYLPAWLAGFDLRLLGLAASVVLLSRLAGASARRGGTVAALILLLLATSSKFTEFARVGHLPMYWLVLFLFADDLSSDRRRAFVWLGLLLGMRQTAWLLVPPLALAAARDDGPARSRLLPLATAVLVGIGVSLPFLLQGTASFFDGTVRWYANLGDTLYSIGPDWIRGHIGFSGLAYDFDSNPVLSWLRLASVVACWCWPIWPVKRGHDSSSAIGSAALGIAAFSLLSAPTWWYSLLDSVLLLIPSQLALHGHREEIRWRRLAAAGTVLVMGIQVASTAPNVDVVHFDEHDGPRLTAGFGAPEHWQERTFAWALAPRAVVALPRLRPFSGEILISLRPAQRLASELKVQLNGRDLATVRPTAAWQTIRLPVSDGLVVLGNNALTIFGQAPEHSPEDPRHLTVGIDEIVLAARP